MLRVRLPQRLVVQLPQRGDDGRPAQLRVAVPVAVPVAQRPERVITQKPMVEQPAQLRVKLPDRLVVRLPPLGERDGAARPMYSQQENDLHIE